MDVVAIVGLARSVDDEAPRLAADLRLTVYETAVMLRAPPPVIVFRSEDRNRVNEVLSKIRSRGHDAVACELESVVMNDAMFRPRWFRFDGEVLIGHANGAEQQRLTLSSVFALLRAQHATRNEDVFESSERQLSLGRASMTGGLVMSKVHAQKERRVTIERENVLYVFRADGPPWLFRSMQMRYDGLGQAMRPSRLENFEVLQQMLRNLAPTAPYDTRLMAIRVATNKVITQGPGHISASSAATIDLLAHILTMSLSRAQNPYR